MRLQELVFILAFSGLTFSHASIFGQSTPQNLPMTNSEEIECSQDLKIKKFQLAQGASTYAYPFKIAIGHMIDYKAKPTTGTWTWLLGSSSAGNFTPYNMYNSNFSLSISTASGTTMLNNAASPLTNNDLGSTYGTLQVSNGSQAPVTENIQVFFEKDALNIHDQTVPNWFFYWKDVGLIQAKLTIPGIPLWDMANCAFNSNPTSHTLIIKYEPSPPYNPAPNAPNSYGGNFFGVKNFPKEDTYPDCDILGSPSQQVVSQYYEMGQTTDARTMYVGNACGYAKTNSSGGADHGIHVFYRTVAHEVEHALIDCQLWYTGFSTLQDVDNDGYPDQWELSDPDAINFLFSVQPSGGPNDSYGLDASGQVVTYVPAQLGQTPFVYSSGTEYEEDRCRTVEQNLTLQNIDGYDWSYDPTNNHQGKQWK